MKKVKNASINNQKYTDSVKLHIESNGWHWHALLHLQYYFAQCTISKQFRLCYVVAKDLKLCFFFAESCYLIKKTMGQIICKLITE